MSDQQTDVLRRRMTSYASAIPTGQFDLGAAERVAHRRTTARNAIAVGAALALVIGAVVGVSAVHGNDPQRVRTAETAATQGLPGLEAAGSVTLPAGLTPLQVERDGDVVWAVATNAAYQPVVLHGRVGGELTVLDVDGDLNGVEVAGSDVTIALSGGRAFVALSSGSTTTGRTRVPYLDERNAETGADEVGWLLDGTRDPQGRNLDADGAALVRSDGGTPVLAITSDSADRQTLRFATLDPGSSPLRDLLSTDVTPPVVVPDDQLQVSPHTPSFTGLTFVAADHGVPAYAYLSGTYDTVVVLDLRSGAVTTYRTGSHLPGSGGGMDAEAVGAVGGRVVFTVEGDDHDTHAEIAMPGERKPVETGPAGGGVLVEAGRIFQEKDTGHGADLQQLSAGTLRPTGPVAFLPDSGTLTTHGPYDVQAFGDDQLVAFYAAP